MHVQEYVSLKRLSLGLEGLRVLCACSQVVGAFLEGGTPEETAAIKKVADERPTAPSDIDMLGLDFAAKL